MSFLVVSYPPDPHTNSPSEPNLHPKSRSPSLSKRSQKSHGNPNHSQSPLLQSASIPTAPPGPENGSATWKKQGSRTETIAPNALPARPWPTATARTPSFWTKHRGVRFSLMTKRGVGRGVKSEYTGMFILFQVSVSICAGLSPSLPCFLSLCPPHLKKISLRLYHTYYGLWNRTSDGRCQCYFYYFTAGQDAWCIHVR